MVSEMELDYAGNWSDRYVLGSGALYSLAGFSHLQPDVSATNIAERHISYYSWSALDALLSSLCPLSHYHSIWDLIHFTSYSGSDGRVFPHQQALIAALHLTSRSSWRYYSYEASEGPVPLPTFPAS